MTTFDVTGPLPSGTLVLEASAGTGKTSAIAGLVARYVAEAGIDLGHIMIATFSGASTRELRARVREQLETVAAALASGIGTDAVSHVLTLCSGQEKEDRHARVVAALAGFDAATICTTHQFCDRMLTELGVLVDHEPDAILVDDLSKLLEATIADEYLARYSAVDSAPFDLKTATIIGTEAALNFPYLPLAPAESDAMAAERVRFGEAVRREVERRKRRAGLYTFDDMQLRLRDALTSPQADAARSILRRRYPVVLIDEFQDTDPVQWEIVRQAFIGEATVVLIGDPKQSIYGFRGADVFAYLDATDQARVQVLDTNHRSDPRVVRAVSTVFAGAELGDPRIRVTGVFTDDDTPRLITEGPARQAFRLRYLPDQVKPDQAIDAIDHDLVGDITQLVGCRAELKRPRSAVRRPLVAGDIAVIVTTNGRGQAIGQKLSNAGIPAVLHGSSSVFETDAAEDWRTLLVAFTRPRTREVRAVALTDFIGWTIADLAGADESALGELSQQVRRWQRLAATKGVAGLYEVMTAVDGVARRLLIRRGGDRTVTDLRHVADLLQAQQTRSGMGMAQLLDWLTTHLERRRVARDERSRRLETDTDAVQIMTVHQAKGLQFPVVYLPEMTTQGRWRDQRYPKPFPVHVKSDSGNTERHLDVGGDAAAGSAARREAYEREEAGERLRWLYVAMTRAECHITAWWAPTEKTEASPLHRVLFRDPRRSEVPPAVPCDRRPDTLDRLKGTGMTVEPIGASLATVHQPSLPPLGGAAVFEREVDRAWRRTSYSALTADAHHWFSTDQLLQDEPADPSDAIPPQPEDAPPSAVVSPLDANLAQPSPMAELPGGVAFGSLVHAVFENFDPSNQSTLDTIVASETSRLPVPGVTNQALAAGLAPALHTPLGPLFAGRRLKDIAAGDRLPELDFELPLGARDAPGNRAARLATLHDIVALLTRHLAPNDPLVEYPERLRSAGLSADPLLGFLTGSIDAAIRINDRVVVVDYKTNRLAPPGVELTLGHYTASAMAEAMMASHYPLQALLYSVALHRFLRWRWPHYDPECQLGGVGYLFVRGMAGPDTPVVDGMPTGVFTWRPPTTLVTDLSDLLAGNAASDAGMALR